MSIGSFNIYWKTSTLPFRFSISILNFKTGNYFRRRFVKKESFLSEHFNESEIRIESTNYPRTKSSVISQLYGLYPYDKLDVESKINIIDDMYPNPRNCPRINYFMAKVQKSPKWVEYHKELGPFKEKILKMLNLKEKDLLDWLGMFDIFNCMETHDKNFPNGITKEISKKFKRIVEFEWTQYSKDKDYLRFGIGMFIKRIYNQFKRKIEGKESLKMILYSGHDTSIAPILAYFNVYPGEHPDYASNIILSLFEENNQYFVKMEYNSETLKIEGCGEFCPFEIFEKFVLENSPSEQEYKSICKMENAGMFNQILKWILKIIFFQF
jgi:hypothetical protein